MKNKYLIFEVEWQVNQVDYISFFAIPETRTQAFIDNPELVNKTLDAKPLYLVEYSKYQADMDYHDARIDDQFNVYVDYMMKLVGCTE